MFCPHALNDFRCSALIQRFLKAILSDSSNNIFKISFIGLHIRQSFKIPFGFWLIWNDCSLVHEEFQVPFALTWVLDSSAASLEMFEDSWRCLWHSYSQFLSNYIIRIKMTKMGSLAVEGSHLFHCDASPETGVNAHSDFVATIHLIE